MARETARHVEVHLEGLVGAGCRCCGENRRSASPAKTTGCCGQACKTGDTGGNAYAHADPGPGSCRRAASCCAASCDTAARRRTTCCTTCCCTARGRSATCRSPCACRRTGAAAASSRARCRPLCGQGRKRQGVSRCHTGKGQKRNAGHTRTNFQHLEHSFWVADFYRKRTVK